MVKIKQKSYDISNEKLLLKTGVAAKVTSAVRVERNLWNRNVGDDGEDEEWAGEMTTHAEMLFLTRPLKEPKI